MESNRESSAGSDGRLSNRRGGISGGLIGRGEGGEGEGDGRARRPMLVFGGDVEPPCMTFPGFIPPSQLALQP